MLNHKLAGELTTAKDALEAKTDELTTKLGKLSVRNRIQCRDNQIATLKEQVKEKIDVEGHLKKIETTSKRPYGKVMIHLHIYYM